MPTIVLDNVTKFYKWEHRLRAAVQSIDLTIRQGEFVFLIGSSGAGKSTIINLIAGQIAPDWGSISLGGKDVRPLRFWNRRRGNAMFGHVQQEPSLVRKRTIEENLLLAMPLKGRRRRRLEPGSKQEQRINKVLGLVGMQGAQKKYPVELSTADCWKIELAKAMINSPPVLLIDEIASTLDDDSIWDMFHLLQELNRKGTTIIMATRASQYVNILRRRVITLVDGQVFGDVQEGRYGDVM